MLLVQMIRLLLSFDVEVDAVDKAALAFVVRLMSPLSLLIFLLLLLLKRMLQFMLMLLVLPFDVVAAAAAGVGGGVDLGRLCK